MTVQVVGTGPVPTLVSDMGLKLWPDKRTETDWARAMTLVDRRLARVVDVGDLAEYTINVDGKPALYWLSPFSQGDGYATAAESMLYWLLQLGVVASVHHSWFLVKEGLRAETLHQLQHPVNEQMLVGVCMATPGEFVKLPTPYKVGFTMYEATNPLRVYPEWVHQCGLVDRLFVPSAFCKDVFSRFVRKPIDVVPLAIHEDYCTPVKRKERDVFQVVTFATLTGRKSPLEMVDVFQRAFPRDKFKDVRFVLKTRLELLGSKTPNIPQFDDDRVVVHSGTWPLERIKQLLLDSDCMLFLSKGEGFGMTPREAMATGLPVVLADNTGMSDVCDTRYNWPIRTAQVEVSPLGGDWYIPDWDDAVDALRWLYTNRKRAYNKAYEGALWYNRKHGPKVAAKAFINTLYGKGSPTREFARKLKLFSSDLPELATVTPGVQSEALQLAGIDGCVELHTYGDLSRLSCKRRNVLLGPRLGAMTREQIRYVVDFLLTAGASSVLIVLPSVYQELDWKVSRPWRLEELQHTLKGLSVPVFRYLPGRLWMVAKVVPLNSQRLGGFGSVIDKRWKPT